MGNKRVSMRTLPSGERVRHFPPDDAHPEGKMQLVAGPSPLRARLLAAQDDHLARQQELRQANLDRIEAKRADQAAKGLPPEKSVI